MDKPLDTAFLLTAGVGSRLRPHTDNCPKSSLPFLTLPLCYFSFFLCKQADLENYIFNLHYLPRIVKKTIEDIRSKTKLLHISDETNKILGSGGAFYGARDFIKPLDSFLVANGDEVMFPNDSSILSSLKEEFKKTSPLACLLVTDHPELLKSLKPVWVNNHSEIVGFGMNKPKVDCKPFHFTGYKIYSSKILEDIPEGESNIFYDILVNKIAQGSKITTFYVDNLPWFETGNFQSYLRATKECLKITKNDSKYLNSIFHFYGKNFNDWEILQAEDNFMFKPRHLKLPDNFQWSGVVVLDERVSVGDSVKLSNVIASSGVIIEDNADHQDSFLWPRS